MALRLYDHPLSPYSQKIKIALREKGVPFEACLPRAWAAASRTTAWGRRIPGARCRPWYWKRERPSLSPRSF